MENRFSYDIDKILLDTNKMNNKLFCTFSKKEELEELLYNIQQKYVVLYNKIFILEAKNQEDYLCTYNLDFSNIASFPENTILVHRKKETNTLYTINALNTLIRELNYGVLDTSYRINWKDYRNCALLTQDHKFKRIDTELYKIIEIS